MNRWKRPFTLLETLIAMGLTVLLLSLLSFFYRQINQLSAQSEKAQKELFKLRYAENRLSQIFPRVVDADTSDKDFYFFTASDPGSIFMNGSPVSLFFTYDNDTDKSKLLSNTVLGRLFVDQNHRLSLATWPSPARWSDIAGIPPVKLEVLLEDVDGLVLEFFVPPDKGWKPKFNGQPNSTTSSNQAGAVASLPSKEKKEKKSTPSSPPQLLAQKQKIEIKPDKEGEWRRDWSQEFELLPGMVRLTIKYKGEKRVYAFPLSKTQRQIVYNM